MATIITRASKGAALTWTEGDANITNLNTDKIELTDLSVSTGAASSGGSLSYNNTTGEFTFAPADLNSITAGISNVVEDTTPQLGGSLDVNGNAIVSANNGNIALEPNGSGNIQLTPSTGNIVLGATIWPSSDGTNNQILKTDGAGNLSWADASSGATELNDLSDVSYSGAGIQAGDFLVWTSGPGGSYFTNQTFSLVSRSISEFGDVDTSGATVGGEVLTYNSGTSTWEATTPTAGLTDIVQDMSPQLGGSLDVNGNSIVSSSSGDINILPDGTGLANITNLVYREKIYSLGSSDTPTIDPGFGAVQTLAITSGLALPTFEGETAGQSVTLLVSGSGTATGTANHKFAGGNTTLTSFSVISIFYDGTTYWTSIATDFQ